MRPFSYCSVGIGILLIAAGPSTAGDWPQWRGPNRDGTVADFKAPATWSESLTKVWRVEVGEGWSSPVRQGDRVYLHSRLEDDESVHCVKLDSGEPLWEVRYPAAGSVHPAGADHGIGPKSTPAIADGRLYTLGIGSILTCFDAAEGEVIWRKDFAEHFEKPAPSCGTSMSPLILDGVLLVHVGVDAKGELIALDAETGERRWTYDGDGPGYGSPVGATLSGKRQLVAPVSRFLVGLSVEDGSMLWRHPFPTQSSQNILTPVIHRDRVIVGGIGQITAALRWTGGSGEAAIETAWRNPQVPQHMSSPVLAGERLFGLSREKKGQLFCLDARSGETIWTSDGDFAEHVAILHGGGYLIVLTGNGTLFFLESDSDSFEPLASYRVSENRAWAHPVISGNRVVIKDERHLTCWELGDP